MFVIDSSYSIPNEDYTKMKDLVHDLVTQLSAGEGNRIGMIIFGNQAHVYLPLVNLTVANRSEILARINAAPRHLPQYTNTADALCKLSTQSWRNDSNVLQVAIILTDGRSSIRHRSTECYGGDINYVASLLRRMHPQVLVFAIGVGESAYIDYDELSSIASRDYLVAEIDFSGLDMMEAILQYQICYTRMCCMYQISLNVKNACMCNLSS